MTELFLILASLAAVSFGAEVLVRSASVLALRADVSSLFVGLTIVAFGTSSPELGAGIAATLQGLDDVTVGNVVGSNIFNIACILGLAACICPIRVQLKQVRTDLLIAVLAALVPFSALAFNGSLPRLGGAFLFTILVLYLVRSYRTARVAASEGEELSEEVLQDVKIGSIQRLVHSSVVHVLLVFAGLSLLIFGSKLFVEEAVGLA